VGLEGDQALVADCGIDDAVVYDIVSGSRLNDVVETRLWRIEVRRVEGRWRVYRLDTEQLWNGVSQCG
jgi:hypothetical protein